GQGSQVAAISHDDTCMLVASRESNSGALCDATTGRILRTFEGHSKRIGRAAFAPVLRPSKEMSGGRQPDVGTGVPMAMYLATSSYDNTVRIWEVDTGICIAIFDGLGSGVNGVCWSPNADLLAIACGKAARVYDAATRDLVCTFEGHRALICNLSFSPNGQLLGSASNDHTARIWSIPKKQCIAILTGPTDEVNAVEFSPDGQFIAAAADDGVWVW
ncbi:WD40 repeat-like protein, partial [Mycena alexandri]